MIALPSGEQVDRDDFISLAAGVAERGVVGNSQIAPEPMKNSFHRLKVSSGPGPGFGGVGRYLHGVRCLSSLICLRAALRTLLLSLTRNSPSLGLISPLPIILLPRTLSLGLQRHQI